MRGTRLGYKHIPSSETGLLSLCNITSSSRLMTREKGTVLCVVGLSVASLAFTHLKPIALHFPTQLPPVTVTDVSWHCLTSLDETCLRENPASY